MISRLTALLALISLGLTPSVVRAQKASATCPTEAPIMRQLAVSFARSADYQATRAKYRLPRVDSAQVRTLSTQQGDGTTCTKLIQLVQASDAVLAGSGFRLTFYQAGAHYYVVGVRADWVTPPPAGTIRLGWSTLWVVTGSGKQRVVAKIAV